MSQRVAAENVSDDSGVIHEDEFSIADLGGDPSAVLGKLRTRLLDLTLTNRLLKFREGPRTVRVIDELPDQLFSRLQHGDELEFLPVPEPPSVRRTEGAKKQDRERAALEHAARSSARSRGGRRRRR